MPHMKVDWLFQQLLLDFHYIWCTSKLVFHFPFILYFQWIWVITRKFIYASDAADGDYIGKNTGELQELIWKVLLWSVMLFM